MVTKEASTPTMTSPAAASSTPLTAAASFVATAATPTALHNALRQHRILLLQVVNPPRLHPHLRPNPQLHRPHLHQKVSRADVYVFRVFHVTLQLIDCDLLARFGREFFLSKQKQYACSHRHDAPSTRSEQALLLRPLHHVVAARLGKPSLLISLPCNCNACTWSERQAAAANARTKRDVFTVVGGAGQRARWRHCGAPILRRYATTSALFQLMASWSAVSPPLQRRK